MDQQTIPEPAQTGRRIRHIVLFRFKAETTQSDRESFLEMLRAMPPKISEIKSFEAGFDLVRAPRSFDLALVTSYDDLAALDRYAKHEHHLPVIERSKEICEQVVAADFEFWLFQKQEQARARGDNGRERGQARSSVGDRSAFLRLVDKP